jgi:hypothetical protein
VQPSPHKPVAADVQGLFEATHVDLPALFDGKDPFAPSEPRTTSPAASRTTSRISANNKPVAKNRPTAGGFKRYMEASGHAPLRFHDAVSRGLYFRAYVRTLTN